MIGIFMSRVHESVRISDINYGDAVVIRLARVVTSSIRLCHMPISTGSVERGSFAMSFHKRMDFDRRPIFIESTNFKSE
jgi:hypothetical protein